MNVAKTNYAQTIHHILTTQKKLSLTSGILNIDSSVVDNNYFAVSM